MTENRFKQAAQLARARGMGKAGLALAIGVLFTAGAAKPAETFHPARTPAERAMLNIISNTDEGRDNGFTVLGHKRTGPGAPPLFQKLTPALIDAIGRTERRMSQQACGGKLHGDGYCGLDYDPIGCTDGGIVGGVDTVKSSANEALIAFEHTNPAGERQGLYRMKRVQGVWKIDGINCSGGSHGQGFNMK